MRVQHGKEDVGYIQALFVSMHDRNKGPLSFRLSGRAWEVGRSTGQGRPSRAPDGAWSRAQLARLPGVLSSVLCQTMMDVLLHEREEAGWLSPAAALELASMRASYDGLLEKGTAPLEDRPMACSGTRLRAVR